RCAPAAGADPDRVHRRRVGQYRGRRRAGADPARPLPAGPVRRPAGDRCGPGHRAPLCPRAGRGVAELRRDREPLVTFGDSPGRTIASLVLAGLVAPAICWVLLGMPPEQALFVAAVAVTVAALVRFPPDGYDIGFPEPPDPVRDRGARREAFRLSWNVAGRED